MKLCANWPDYLQGGCLGSDMMFLHEQLCISFFQLDVLMTHLNTCLDCGSSSMGHCIASSWKSISFLYPPTSSSAAGAFWVVNWRCDGVLASQRSCCDILTPSANDLALSRCLLSSPYTRVQIQVGERLGDSQAW